MDFFENDNIMKEDIFKSKFNTIYQSSDYHMKNIEKTIKKIINIYQFESHEATIKNKVNSSHHL